MTDDREKKTEANEAAVPLKPWERWCIAATLLILAVLHGLFPTRIDATVVALVAVAAVVVWFDIDRLEIHGIQARRRRLARVAEAVEQAALPPGAATPEPPTLSEITGAGGSSASPAEAQGTGTVSWPPRNWLQMPSDPMPRLFWAIQQIYIELVILAGNSGHLPDRADFDRYVMPQLVEVLLRAEILSPELAAAIREVRRTRNAIAIGNAATLAEDAADLAVEVLYNLRDIKRNYYRVSVPSVDLFRDPELREPHEMRGVILAELDSDGKLLRVRCFPRLLDYATGQFTTWEWSPTRALRGEGWYRNPQSGEFEHAFSSSIAFWGRPYPQHWVLELRFDDREAGLH
jgi:hypothetical protein